MAGRKLLGVDIGTQATKAVLFDEDGTALAAASQKSRLHQPREGVVEEDPEIQFRSVCKTIKACMEQSRVKPELVAGIAIDGQMAGILGVGSDGRNVTPYDSWLDTRCASYISEMQEEAGFWILKKAGCSPSFNHGPKILWWMHERPQVYRRIASFVQPASYAAMRLCGLKASEAYIDRTYLHFSGFANNRQGEWDRDLGQRFGLDMEKLPKIYDSHRIVGEIRAAAAKNCGLRPGVPVVAGCGDTAASFLSCGAAQEGICVDVAGTASVFASTTPSFAPDLAHYTLACGHSPVPGLWHPYAYIAGGGLNLEWYRGKAIPSPEGEISLKNLDRLAADLLPLEGDPYFIPHLGGQVCPSRPRLRGAWAGLGWNHNHGHLYRAVLEGVALEYGIYLDIMGEIYPGFRPREIRVTGGGEKSAVWNQMKADILGVPVVQIEGSEGAPQGSALLAGFGVGAFPDIAEAAGRWIRTARRFAAAEGKRSLYRKRKAGYRRLLEALSGWAGENV